MKHCHPPAPGLPPVTPARQSVRQLSGHLSAALWPGSDQTSRHRGKFYGGGSVWRPPARCPLPSHVAENHRHRLQVEPITWLQSWWWEPSWPADRVPLASDVFRGASVTSKANERPRFFQWGR